jgi:hypothetical protein
MCWPGRHWLAIYKDSSAVIVEEPANSPNQHIPFNNLFLVHVSHDPQKNNQHGEDGRQNQRQQQKAVDCQQKVIPRRDENLLFVPEHDHEKQTPCLN